jgi:hypothetical protein
MILGMGETKVQEAARPSQESGATGKEGRRCGGMERNAIKKKYGTLLLRCSGRNE